MLKSRKIPAPASDRKDKRSRDESSPPTKTGDIVEEKNKPKLVEVATQVLRSVRTDKEVEIRQLDWDNRQDSVLLDDQREAERQHVLHWSCACGRSGLALQGRWRDRR